MYSNPNIYHIMVINPDGYRLMVCRSDLERAIDLPRLVLFYHNMVQPLFTR